MNEIKPEQKTSFFKLDKNERKEKAHRWMDSKGFLAAVSILLGIVIWFVVYTSIDYNTTRTIRDVPVTIDLTGTIAESNGLDVVDTEQKYVDIKINGRSYQIGKLSTDNFKATLSVTQVTEAGVYTDLPINVEKVDTNYDFSIVSISPSTLSVEFDSMDTETYDLEVSIPNVEAASGYLINAYSATPATVTISGPDSIVQTIDRCVVENDNAMTLMDSETLEGELHLYDEAGNEIVSDALTYDTTEYTISVPLYKKETIPLTYDFINVPEGLDTSKLSFTVDPAEVTVAVPVSAAASVQSLSLGEIDFRKLDLKESNTFNIPMLAGYISLDDVTEATVTFDSTGYSKGYYSSDNIVIQNIPDGYSVEPLTNVVTDIQIVGKTGVLNKLTAQDLVLTADLANISLNEGEQRVPVTITLTSDLQAWAIGEKYIFLEITREDTETES